MSPDLLRPFTPRPDLVLHSEVEQVLDLLMSFFVCLEYPPWGVCPKVLRWPRRFGLLKENEVARPRRCLGGSKRSSSWHAFIVQLDLATPSTIVVLHGS